MREDTFCTCVSSEMQENLHGTATQAEIWCLLEYTARWNEFAIKDSMLSAPVQAWLTEAQRQYPTFRPQFIKQHEHQVQTIACFIAVTHQERQTLYQFQFADYEDLLQVDLAALLDTSPHYASYEVHTPLLFICTHGKHDRCCARFGAPLYQEAAKMLDKHVWQISHIGGDRFAANLLCLPQAICYGRVTRSDLAPIIQACHNQQIYLEKYRGRCYFPALEQAADYFLRMQTGNTNLNAFALSHQETINKSCTRVIFRSLETGDLHCLTLHMTSTEVTHVSICQGQQTRTIQSYQLQDYVRQYSLPSIPPPLPEAAMFDNTVYPEDTAIVASP